MPHNTRITFLTDSYKFCLNYPAIHCIITHNLNDTRVWLQKQNTRMESNHACTSM